MGVGVMAAQGSATELCASFPERETLLAGPVTARAPTVPPPPFCQRSSAPSGGAPASFVGLSVAGLLTADPNDTFHPYPHCVELHGIVG